MVDRILEYPIEVPVVEDDLRTNRNFMVGLGKLAEASIGSETIIQGLLCKPTTPSSMEVLVEAGQIYSWENIDDSAYSELPQDTAHQIVKQGIELDETTLACPAPLTAGFSINYLVQIQFDEADNLGEMRAFYNSADPSQPFYQFVDSQREDKCLVTVKAGTAAATGTQVTPLPDAEHVGAWVVTVAQGQITIETGDITEYPDAPFIKPRNTLYNAYVTNDGSDNYSGASQPPMAAYDNGVTVILRVDSENDGDSTLDLGPGPIQMIDMENRILQSGELQPDFPYIVIYSNSKWVVQVKSSGSGGGETGDTKYSYRVPAEEPEWIWMNDGAIGPTGASGIWTEARYDDDTKDLYFLLYANCADAECPVDGGRTTVAADWAAAKTLRLPQADGRSAVAFGSGTGLTPRTTLGATGGEEDHQLTIAELAAHTHTYDKAGSLEPQTGTTTNCLTSLASTPTGSTGSDTAHNTMHPFTTEYKYIKK